MLFKLTRLPLLLASLLIFSGCKATASEPVAALSKQTSSEAKVEIQQAIVKLKGGARPILADNVFEVTDILLISKTTPKNNFGQPLVGRHFQMPSQFNLQLRGKTCGLYYAKTQTFMPLKLLTCIAKKHQTTDRSPYK